MKKMERCAHCHKIRNDNTPWKSVTARYHEVEIHHLVCPQCYALPFPRFYRLYNDSSFMRPYSNGSFDEHSVHSRRGNQARMKIFPVRDAPEKTIDTGSVGSLV
jgi:hypothetical protein